MRKIYLLLLSVILFSLQKTSAQLVINSFFPKAGPAGTVFSIMGSNLNDSTVVKIGATPALIVSNTGAKLTAMVMPGSVSGKVYITTRGGVDSSESFSITVSNPPSNQVQKLTGTGTVSNADIGMATAISADNKTIALGGAADSMGQGAVWIYSRDSVGEWVQYGKKLVPTNASATAQIGQHLAVNADGTTLITGGMNDSSATGAAWIFVKDTSGNWVQQAKLVGTGAVGPAKQGWSVAISADGNTAATGGYADSATITTLGVGAAWVFVRDSAGIWKQQGNKLVGRGAVGSAAQGSSVAISADGNTIMSGGIADSNNVGAVWVFVRNSDSTWKQQGPKIKITNGDHPLAFGFSVALNADGNTAIIGSDDSYNVFGGAWIFVRDDKNKWTQQGSKLVGTDTAYTGGKMEQGRSVAISADGNTAISGGYGDNGGQGGAWIFTRNNNTWSQYGYKLLGSNVTGPYAQQGYSVSINTEGSIALIGGPSDNYGQGAGWVFGDSSHVLPVAIAKFRAYSSGKGVQTEWTTYSEINMDRYIVERSTDEQNFKEQHCVWAKGEAVKNDYAWFDPSPLKGNNFYRLKAIDKNGSIEYSSVIKITIGTPGSIRLFPNPVVDKTFFIQLNDLPAGNYIFAVYNSASKKVYSTQYIHDGGTEAVRIDLKNIPGGIYHVEVADSQQRYQTKVLIR